MANYVLSCCSTADVSRTLLDARNIAYVYFTYELDGVIAKDDFWESISPTELYSQMLAGADVKTSQVAVGEFSKHFEKYLEQGLDVIHVTLSSGISNTYNSACLARDSLAERYPDRNIFIIDSLCASSGYGLLVDTLADLRDEGMGIEDLARWAEDHRLELQHWFFSTDLTFFIRGGRISKTSGFAANLLKICPLMWVAPDGSLGVRYKIRTKNKAMARDLEIMEQFAEGGLSYNGKVFISHSDCLEDAQELAQRIEQRFPATRGKIEIFPVGAVIGCHTGPGTVALFYWGSARTEE